MTHIKTSINGALSAWGKIALDILLPPQCLGCRSIVDEVGSLCPGCWEKVDFAGPPYCAICGLTFEYDAGDGLLCGACLRQSPVYQRARTVMVYGEISSKIIIFFKHGDGTEVVASFATWMLRAGSELIAGADVVVPVPLHWMRLFRRRYNQSAMLAFEIARRAEIAINPDVLVRRRRTRSQGGLGSRERWRNLKAAFAVKPSLAHVIKDKRVLLIDDVMTTGATVSSCAGTLLDGGAKAVDVLTLARVMRPSL